MRGRRQKMNIFHDFDSAHTLQSAVVTTGSFDGVHVGHQAIIRSLNLSAAAIGGESALITFHPHPRKVLFPQTAGKDLLLINSQSEKIELLRTTGLQNLIIIDFTPQFSQISSDDFVRHILIEKLHVAKVIIGFNHQFGHNRTGNFDFLRHLGQLHHFAVEEIPEQDIQNETVSSTLIRKALQEGRIQRANAYLDHHYFILGKLKPSHAYANRTLHGFELEIEEDCKLVPPDGVYAVKIGCGNRWVKGLVLIKDSRYDHLRDFTQLKVVVFPLGEISPSECPLATIRFARRLHDLRDESLFMDKWLEQDRIEAEEMIY